MILTAHFDESGTHAGSPVTIMSGVMGNAGQWSRFQGGIDHLKRKYGFTVYHFKDFKARSGEFKGWSDEKCANLLYELMHVSSRLMEAATCALPNSDFDLYYKNNSGPRRLRLDTRYALCFRYVLTHFILEAHRRLGTHRKFPAVKIRVVLESGHKNAGDVERVYREMDGELRAWGCSILESISFAKKRDCDPLMIADYLASGEFQLEKIEPDRLREDAEPARGRKITGMTYLRFHPEGLTQLKSRLVAGFQQGGGWKATFLSREPAG